MIALRRPGIGAQVIEGRLLQRSPVIILAPIDQDRIAAQLDPDRLHDKRPDIAAGDMGLAFRGRKPDLVLAGLERDDQLFEREIV